MSVKVEVKWKAKGTSLVLRWSQVGFVFYVGKPDQQLFQQKKKADFKLAWGARSWRSDLLCQSSVGSTAGCL